MSRRDEGSRPVKLHGNVYTKSCTGYLHTELTEKFEKKVGMSVHVATGRLLQLRRGFASSLLPGNATEYTHTHTHAHACTHSHNNLAGGAVLGVSCVLLRGYSLFLAAFTLRRRCHSDPTGSGCHIGFLCSYRFNHLARQPLGKEQNHGLGPDKKSLYIVVVVVFLIFSPLLPILHKPHHPSTEQKPTPD